MLVWKLCADYFFFAHMWAFVLFVHEKTRKESGQFVDAAVMRRKQ